MRHVFNGDDMRDMVLELAANLVSGWDVCSVRVDDVDPAGMVLMARMLAVVDGGTYDGNDTALRDVPVSFADIILSGHSAFERGYLRFSRDNHD